MNKYQKMKILVWLFSALFLKLFCYECQMDNSFNALINKQLAYFSNGITDSMIQRASKYESMIKVTFYNGAVSTSKTLDSKTVIFLKEIALLVPNLSFAYNTHDEPRVLKGDCKDSPDWKTCACDQNFTDFSHGFFIKPCTWSPIYQKLPVFSPSSIPECFLDIIMPSKYHISDHYFPSRIPWPQKQFKVMWRGEITGGHFGFPWCSKDTFQPRSIHFSQFHRQRLVDICSKIEDCDAKFSGYKYCSKEVCAEMRKAYGQPSCILMQNQAINKLIIDIDGFSYSRRFPILMATGSVVIKIASFVDIGTVPAEPWVHFIPVKMDLSDLEDSIRWAKENDKKLQQMGLRGKQLVFRTLKYKHYKCYMTKLLLKYQSLIVSDETFQANVKRNKDLAN